MNKTTKLIFWQRITIGVLLFSLGAAGIGTYKANMLRLQAEERTAKANQTAEYIRVQMELNLFKDVAVHRNLSDQEKIIADMDRQLKKYEAKYGHLPREGEGTVFNPTDNDVAPAIASLDELVAKGWLQKRPDGVYVIPDAMWLCGKPDMGR